MRGCLRINSWFCVQGSFLVVLRVVPEIERKSATGKARALTSWTTRRDYTLKIKQQQTNKQNDIRIVADQLGNQ